MRVRRCFLFAALIAFLLPAAVYGFEWPTSEKRVVSTFGEFRNGDYLKGIEIAGKDMPVQPVLSGTVIFYRRAERLNRGMPGGLGNMVVVQHERGIRTLYGYLRNMQLDSFSEERLDPDTLLGYSGGSAGAEVDGLYFQVIDGEFQRIVNPLLSLSSHPDTTAPRVRDLFVRTDEGLITLRNGISIPQGEFEVIVETFDVSEALDVFQPMCPYTVRLMANGEEVANIEFDAVEAEDQRHVLVGGDGRPAEAVYDEEQWRMRIGTVSFRPKDVQLEVAVTDFSGNETSKRYRVSVRE